MTRPTLQDLEAFATLARHASLRKTADIPDASRSALSHPTLYDCVPRDIATATRAQGEMPDERLDHGGTQVSANAHGKAKVT